MAIIYSYPTVDPVREDLILGTDVSSSNKATKNFTIQSIIDLVTVATGDLQTVLALGNVATGFDIDLTKIGGSALTDSSLDVPTQESTGIPITYVPARNTIFLSIAASYAETLKIKDIFIGVNAIDYSGYPDCRPEFITSFEKMINLGTKSASEGNPFKVLTPLVSMTKSEIINTGIKLGVDYSATVSCYSLSKSGEACGNCDSCKFRKKGFLDAGIADPTLYKK